MQTFVTKKTTPLLILVLAATTVIGALTTAYFASKYGALKANPQQSVSDANQALIEKVGRLVDLPSGETPTIATVTDLAPLASQPFFAKAKVGDKVLIYVKANKAILYDPQTDKVLEIAPLASVSPNPNANTIK